MKNKIEIRYTFKLYIVWIYNFRTEHFFFRKVCTRKIHISNFRNLKNIEFWPPKKLTKLTDNVKIKFQEFFFLFQNDKRLEQRFSKIEERAQVNKAVPKSDSTSLQDWESIESPDSLQCKKILMLIIWLECNPSNYILAKNVKIYLT
jgi:hypothetical protein